VNRPRRPGFPAHQTNHTLVLGAGSSPGTTTYDPRRCADDDRRCPSGEPRGRPAQAAGDVGRDEGRDLCHLDTMSGSEQGYPLSHIQIRASESGLQTLSTDVRGNAPYLCRFRGSKKASTGMVPASTLTKF
jgi:hypothetical protein